MFIFHSLSLSILSDGIFANNLSFSPGSDAYGSVLFWCGTRIILLAVASAASLANWECPHIDVSTTNRAMDWWYVQVLGQTPAPNGIPPSLEVVLHHG